VWNLTGHLILRVTSTSAANTVISGLFFDPANVSHWAIGGSVPQGIARQDSLKRQRPDVLEARPLLLFRVPISAQAAEFQACL